MHCWAVMGPDGLWISSLELSRRQVERSLVQEYVGAERSWEPGYRELFERDLARRLEDEGLRVVRVELTVIGA